MGKNILNRSALLLICIILQNSLCFAQDQNIKSKVQVVQLEKLDINEGLITEEIAKRFNPKIKPSTQIRGVTQTDKIEVTSGQISREVSRKVDTVNNSAQVNELKESVEDRIKGAFTAALAQELSATKLLQLAVRDKSLEALKREWQVSEELGKSKGGDEAEMSVEKADYIATVKIEDFVADRKVLGNEEAAIWSNLMSASFELTRVGTGTKKIITESVSDGGKGRKGVGGEASNFNAQQIRDLTQKLAKRLAERILDNVSPPKVIAQRGRKIIIDRGLAAGVSVGDTFTLIEKADNSFGTDAGFPLGTATVEFVNEDTSNLNLDNNTSDISSPSNVTLSRTPKKDQLKNIKK